MSRILWISTILFALTALGTTFVERTFPEIVKDAPIIVRGTVEYSESRWAMARDGTKRIYTFTAIRREEVLKGAMPRERFEAREIGGEIDGVGLDVPGSARFTKGEVVVVLLNSPANADDSYDVFSMTMGKYEIVRDQNGEDSIRGGVLGAAESAQAPEDGQRGWTLPRLRGLIEKQGGKALVLAENPTKSIPAGSPTSLAGMRADPKPESEPRRIQEDSGRMTAVQKALVVSGIVLALIWVRSRIRRPRH